LLLAMMLLPLLQWALLLVMLTKQLLPAAQAA
jgi:hypothetical protein